MVASGKEISLVFQLTMGPVAQAEPGKRRGRRRHTEPSDYYLERREAILERAAALFRENGFAGTSIEDVARDLDMSKATVYYYIPSKAVLLAMIADRAMSRALEKMERVAEIPDPMERLKELIRHQVYTIAAEPWLFNVFFDQKQYLDEQYREQLKIKERRYLKVFIEAIKACIEAGYLPTHINPRYAAHAIMGMTSWLYKWYEPERDNVDEFLEACLALVIKR
jgi:AcrR family transcriptional regulator